MDEVRPGAIGWIGSTGGMNSDGELCIQARFASDDEARRNSDRLEQSAWWREMEQQFSGPVTFHGCRDVAMLLDGGDDQPASCRSWSAARTPD